MISEKELKKTRKEIHAGVVKKFGNLSRFSALSQIPYPVLYRVLITGTDNEAQIERVKNAFEQTEDKPLDTEVSDELIQKVKYHMMRLDNTKAWMEFNAVPGWWLKEFYAGHIRFKNKKVLRLLRLLQINDE